MKFGDDWRDLCRLWRERAESAEKREAMLKEDLLIVLKTLEELKVLLGDRPAEASSSAIPE